MAKRACQGKTKKGTPCKAAPLTDSEFCIAHSDREVQESTGFGGAQPGSGRPRLPKPHEVYREKLEAEVAEWWDVLTGARDATYQRLIGYGDDAQVVEEDDHRTRLKAFEVAHDRIYGRPRQVTEHTGAEGGPIEVAPFDFSRLSEDDLRAYRDLLARAAAPGAD